MLTRKQLLLGIGLTMISKVVIATPANAWPDSIGIQLFNSSAFPGSGSISIPPGINLSSGSTDGSSGSSSASSGSTGGSSGSSGDVNTATASNSGDDSNNATASNNSETITIADIADYFASSIDQSLNEFDTSTLAQGPRRIVRRSSSVSCPNPQISRSSESLDDLLNQSQKFIEQVNQLKPENSPW